MHLFLEGTAVPGCVCCNAFIFSFAVRNRHILQNFFYGTCKYGLHVITKKSAQHNNFFGTRAYRQKKTLHGLTIFFCIHIFCNKNYRTLPQKKSEKKVTRLYCKEKKLHGFTKNKKYMHEANLPNPGPLLILSPALKCWGPPDGRGYVATRPTCGPLLILSPALKWWRPPTWQGLCSHQAHLWATSDFLSPAVKRWGPPTQSGLCSHPAHLWAIADFVPRFEVLGTPQTVGVV